MSGIFGSLSGPGLFNLPNYGYGDVSDKSRAGQMTPRMTRRGAILPLAEYDFPKNLRKILGRLDRDAIPTRVESLQTPSGVFGYRTDTEYSFDPSQTWFSVFGLSPELRRRILSDGFPLFANAPTGAVIPLAIGSSYSDK